VVTVGELGVVGGLFGAAGGEGELGAGAGVAGTAGFAGAVAVVPVGAATAAVAAKRIPTRSFINSLEYLESQRRLSPGLYRPFIRGESLIQGLFDQFAGFPRALLDSSNQLIFAAVFIAKIIIRQLGEFLFQFAFGNVPVSFCLQ
jgi:hypothetical protein